MNPIMNYLKLNKPQPKGDEESKLKKILGYFITKEEVSITEPWETIRDAKPFGMYGKMVR